MTQTLVIIYVSKFHNWKQKFQGKSFKYLDTVFTSGDFVNKNTVL